MYRKGVLHEIWFICLKILSNKIQNLKYIQVQKDTACITTDDGVHALLTPGMDCLS